MHINIPKPNQRPDLVIFPLLEIMPRMILKSTWYEIKSKPKPNNSRSRSTDHRPENYASTQQGIRWISWDWFRLQIWSLLQLMMKASVWEMVWFALTGRNGGSGMMETPYVLVAVLNHQQWTNLSGPMSNILHKWTLNQPVVSLHLMDETNIICWLFDISILARSISVRPPHLPSLSQLFVAVTVISSSAYKCTPQMHKAKYGKKIINLKVLQAEVKDSTISTSLGSTMISIGRGHH